MTNFLTNRLGITDYGQLAFIAQDGSPRTLELHRANEFKDKFDRVLDTIPREQVTERDGSRMFLESASTTRHGYSCELAASLRTFQDPHYLLVNVKLRTVDTEMAHAVLLGQHRSGNVFIITDYLEYTGPTPLLEGLRAAAHRPNHYQKVERPDGRIREELATTQVRQLTDIPGIPQPATAPRDYLDAGRFPYMPAWGVNALLVFPR